MAGYEPVAEQVRHEERELHGARRVYWWIAFALIVSLVAAGLLVCFLRLYSIAAH